MQWKSSPQVEISGVAARIYPVVSVVVEAADPIVVVVEVVGKITVRVAAAAATAVGVGRHLGPTVGVVAAEVGQNPVVVLAG